MSKVDIDLRPVAQLGHPNMNGIVTGDTSGKWDNPLPRSAVIARVSHFNERGEIFQIEYISKIVDSADYSTVSENYISNISSSQNNYDVLFVSGNDPRRMSKLVRLYRPVLADKTKIAVLARSTPPERALLLNGGFDDVFDLRTNPIEARCRVLAHVRRYDVHRRKIADQELRRTNTQRSDNMQFFTRKLTRVETDIFNKLLASLNRPVPLQDLCARPTSDDGPLSHKSLQVFICRIRRKLIPGLKIRLSGSDGYQLCFTDRDWGVS